MICKCSYFNYNEEGVLVCSVCGKPAHEPKIEDKILQKVEIKNNKPSKPKR